MDLDKNSAVGIGLKETEGKIMMNEIWWDFIKEQAKAMTISKQSGKYPPQNWRNPIDPHELLASLERHSMEVKIALQENKPELLVDPTDGVDHLVKLALNASMLQYQLVHHYIFTNEQKNSNTN